MLLDGLIAGAEHSLNRVLRLDSTALPRLGHLHGKVIEIDCQKPALQLFVLPGPQGLMLARHWAGEVDCTLRAPAASLAQLALSKDKTAVLHSPQVDLSGNSAVLLDLVAVLQDLDLDWEYEVQRWIGPVATSLLSGHLRSRAGWARQGLHSVGHNLADYLAEETRTLVGEHEAQARFAELDRLKIDLDRLEARIERLQRSHHSSDNE
ncbi:SCP2 sterol-binding domain-containing protein [Pseudomonas sp. HR96]|uniref:ubiquinone biosynthesis accessory factor UbiJ n=1 Tax=Pseudomonas sp. HR96 TaxID=1027966 RepID=UPI002A747C73|nr:SCP2 sterol-binding domain-containing protein [Pseudomonas sp. HR96]WPO99622.1 SCP2 sterol-binding domain-containing protein [Pseudomonas sp. HR96]